MQTNQIELAGYLAAKPIVRALPSGTKVANARLAEGYRHMDKRTSTVEQHTNWHNLVFYEALAEIAAGYEKGDNIRVEGSLQTRKFTPKDGSERTVHEVIVNSCRLIKRANNRLESQIAVDGGAATTDPESESIAPSEDEPLDWPA